MAKKIDLRHADLSDCKSRVSPNFEIGQRIGDLEIVDNIERRPQGDRYRIQVRCTACDSVYWCRVDHLRSGQSRRCLDCRRRPDPVFAMDCDGHVHSLAGSSTKEHELYQINIRCRNAQQRCQNHQHPQYANYGGRGICFGFNDPKAMLSYVIGLEGFAQALDNGLTIDRIDNNGDYAPGNLRWASIEEQAANRRITCYVDLENGERITRSQAADVVHCLTGHNRKSLYDAFQRGRSFTEVLEFAQRVTGEKVDENEM